MPTCATNAFVCFIPVLLHASTVVGLATSTPSYSCTYKQRFDLSNEHLKNIEYRKHPRKTVQFFLDYYFLFTSYMFSIACVVIYKL